MGKKKILVVDNNPVIIKLMTTFLIQEGHTVVSAEDAFGALDVLRDFTPEIIYLDLIMPKIGGDSLCKIFRTIPLLANCYIAIVSAAAIEHDIDLHEIGADVYIAKGPFSTMRQHILETIAESDSPRNLPISQEIRGVENLHSRQITKELLSQNKHLLIIMERMSQGILSIADNRVFYANPAALFILQVNLEHLLGNYLDKVLDACTWEKLAPLINAKEDMAGDENDTVLTIHGRHIIPQCLTMQDDCSNQVVLLLDITARKQAENELMESEDKFRLTFNFSPDAVNINRLHDGLYVDINEGFTRATGYTHEDVIGKTSMEINVWQNSA